MRTQNKLSPPKGARFVPMFRNGVWKVLDRQVYAFSPPFKLQKLANAEAEARNKEFPWN